MNIGYPIILASASPRRKELFKLITDNFITCVSNIEEVYDNSWTSENIAMHLSKIKALDVAKKYKDNLVIGCDTIVCVDNNILGKPRDKNHAKTILESLSGRTHKVITGVCGVYGDYVEQIHVCTNVKFINIQKDVLAKYIETDEPYDKAGAYGIQCFGKNFVEKYDGDYNNVVGLPVEATKNLVNLMLNKRQKQC